MNITTSYPQVSLNTSNVYTETAKRDNQLREVIPQPSSVVASATDNKSSGDGEKTKLPGQNAEGTSETKGQGKNEDARGIRERDRDQDGESPGEERREGRQEEQQREEAKQIEKLKSRDTEVRIHEQAHASVGGKYAGSPSLEYQRGPDGKSYAVGGEVMIDVSPIPGDPKATIAKMQTVRAAALAPAEPSGADRTIAADATQKMAAAQAELASNALKTDEEKEATNAGVSTAPKRRLVGAEMESEEKRAPDVDARALRIAEFYSAVASPNRTPGFAAQI